MGQNLCKADYYWLGKVDTPGQAGKQASLTGLKYTERDPEIRRLSARPPGNGGKWKVWQLKKLHKLRTRSVRGIGAAILRVNRQVCDEAIKELYNYKFQFACPYTLLNFLVRLPRESIGHLRHISVSNLQQHLQAANALYSALALLAPAVDLWSLRLPGWLDSFPWSLDVHLGPVHWSDITEVGEWDALVARNMAKKIYKYGGLFIPMFLDNLGAYRPSHRPGETPPTNEVLRLLGVEHGSAVLLKRGKSEELHKKLQELAQDILKVEPEEAPAGIDRAAELAAKKTTPIEILLDVLKVYERAYEEGPRVPATPSAASFPHAGYYVLLGNVHVLVPFTCADVTVGWTEERKKAMRDAMGKEILRLAYRR